MSGSGDLPPLNALRAVEAAGRHLNFRASADELGATQGAIAQQVSVEDFYLLARKAESKATPAVDIVREWLIDLSSNLSKALSH